MSLVVEPIWAWWWVATAAVVVLGIVLWTYPPRVAHLAPRVRRTLLSLRLFAAVLLILMLLRPTALFSKTDKQPAVIIFLLDNSRSMTIADGGAGATRRQAMIQSFEKNELLLKKLRDQVEVRFIDFAGEQTPITEPRDNPDGTQTAIGKILDEVRREDSGKRLISVVLMSDGAQRATGEDDLDPRIAARRLAEQKSVPIQPILIGTSALDSAGFDVSVEDLLVPSQLFEKKTVPVKANLRIVGAQGREVTVRLLLEDRAGKAPQESGTLKSVIATADSKPLLIVKPKKNSETIPIELSFQAKLTGEYRIAVLAEPLDGEIKTNNNQRETLITIRKGGLRIAYFDRADHVEQKFLRRLNLTDQIQLDFNVVPSGKAQAIYRLPADIMDAGKYDAYVIGDLPASVFQKPTDLLGRLANRVREGAGLMMIGGVHNFGTGGYSETPLKDLLPVRLNKSDIRDDDKIDRTQHYEKPLQMLPTREGLRHYVMQISTDNSEKKWAELPPWTGAVKLTAKSGAVAILAKSADDIPLLFAADTGGGRVLAMAGDETWKWHLHGFADVHQRFWQQTMMWLSHKENDNQQAVWVLVNPRNFAPRQRVPIAFGARAANGVPVSDAEFKITVKTPDGQVETVTPQRAGENGFAEFGVTNTPGEYWVQVEATKEGQSLGATAVTRFVIDSRDLELDNPSADPELMNELASITGTTLRPLDDFGKYLQELLDHGLQTELTRYTRLGLWDNAILLILFVLIMTTEWALRKRKGLV